MILTAVPQRLIEGEWDGLLWFVLNGHTQWCPSYITLPFDQAY